MDLVPEYLDLDLAPGFLDLALVLEFQALGQVQVRVLLGWAEMSPELRGGRSLPSQHTPQHLSRGAHSKFPIRFP